MRTHPANIDDAPAGGLHRFYPHLYRLWGALWGGLAALAGALLLTGVFLLAAPDPLSAIKAFFLGPWRTAWAAGNTLEQAALLLTAAAGAALGFRGGVFNLGGEGQVYLGGLAAAAALARHAARVTATDLNPRALALARLTCALSDVTADFRLGSLYDPVAGDRFDLIVTNPPFVIAPPAQDADRLVYREAAEEGDGLMRRVVAEAAAHLTDGGTLIVLGNWAHVTGQPWEERVATWVPPTAAAFALQREVLDPCEYAELWLADAGLQGTPGYRAEADRWLAYLDDLHIEGVGLGWLALTTGGPPGVTALDWPYPVTQPVAADLVAHFAARGPAQLPDEAFLATRWHIAPDAYQEAISDPGAADPSRVVYRRRLGLGRFADVDWALGGVLGACDGELALGAILEAVATLGGRDQQDLTKELLPALRQLVADGWLTPADGPPTPGPSADRTSPRPL